MSPEKEFPGCPTSRWSIRIRYRKTVDYEEHPIRVDGSSSGEWRWNGDTFSELECLALNIGNVFAMIIASGHTLLADREDVIMAFASALDTTQELRDKPEKKPPE